MQLFRLGNAVREVYRSFFKSRNIIIISEEAVNHYPLSTKLQIGGIGALLVVVCWISYSTGNYMAAQNVIREKDKAIVHTNLENKKIEHDFSLLKRDLLKLSENKDTQLSEYSKFVLDQYEKQPEQKSNFTLTFDDSPEGDKLIDRIEFLEKQVVELETAKQKIVRDVRERTVGVVQNYEQIISMTGLSPDAMKKHAASKLAVSSDEALKAIVGEGGQGGPFIPYGQTSALDEEHQAMLNELDFMQALGDVVDSLPTEEPVKNYRVESKFGKRIDPFTKRWARHEGVDLSAPRGAKVLATSGGKVSFAGYKGAYGNMVEVSHGYGLTTRYGHLSKVLARNGQEIKEGDVVGIQGSTGRSTGDHVHYEVRLNDRPMNPTNFLKAGTHVQNTQ